ncbi:MAG: cyanophycinase [Bdellovibrionales bacterium]
MSRRKHKGADRTGTLIIIGGREDREKDMVILREFCRYLKSNSKVVVATMASTVGHELWEIYREAFRRLGVKRISHLDVVDRRQPSDQQALKAMEGADAVFFTGGDQLKITSELGGTEVLDRIFELYQQGGVIAGTSAGASVMSETMLVGSYSDSLPRLTQALNMTPGLGLIKRIIIDQHFAERGRITRLIGAVARNPAFLGVGIDEDTAVVMENQETLRVLGRGSVYIIDATETRETEISETELGKPFSIFNLRIHVLSEGDLYDVRMKEPRRPDVTH